MSVSVAMFRFPERQSLWIVRTRLEHVGRIGKRTGASPAPRRSRRPPKFRGRRARRQSPLNARIGNHLSDSALAWPDPGTSRRGCDARREAHGRFAPFGEFSGREAHDGIPNVVNIYRKPLHFALQESKLEFRAPAFVPGREEPKASDINGVSRYCSNGVRGENLHFCLTARRAKVGCSR